MKESSGNALRRALVALSVLLVLTLAIFIAVVNMPLTRYAHYMNLGAKYLLNEEYDDAVRAFSEAVKIEPNDAEPYRARAEAYEQTGQSDLAYQDYLEIERITGETGLADRKFGKSFDENASADASGPSAENASTETPPTETPVPATPTPEPVAPDYDAFFQDVKINPNAYFIPLDGYDLYTYDNPGAVIARGDLDLDGVDEAFVSFTNHGSPYNVISTQVWKWNGSAFELYANIGGSYATMDFYTTGGIRHYPKNPKTLINPYTVEVYNAESKTYDELFGVAGVSPDTMEHYGTYDPALDLDGDGIIYYQNGETPMTQAEYEALIEPYVPDRAHLELNWTDLF